MDEQLGATIGDSSRFHALVELKRCYINCQWQLQAIVVSVHQTQQVQKMSAYHYRINPHEICRILLISRAQPGIDTSYM